MLQPDSAVPYLSPERNVSRLQPLDIITHRQTLSADMHQPHRDGGQTHNYKRNTHSILIDQNRREALENRIQESGFRSQNHGIPHLLPIAGCRGICSVKKKLSQAETNAPIVCFIPNRLSQAKQPGAVVAVFATTRSSNMVANTTICLIKKLVKRCCFLI